jgi:hypothetical protein
MKKACTFTAMLFLALLSNCNQKREVTTATSPTNTETGTPDEIVIESQSAGDTLKGSIKASTAGVIGKVAVSIHYYSPAVRGRIIWGGLVPFDKVWVTGAHRATSIEFDNKVKIAGVTVKPGKYGLFTIPGKKEWTIIINRNWNQHLADQYDLKEDVVRIKVKPEIESEMQERLRYVIESESDHEGEIVIYWEKLEVSLPISEEN